MMANEKTSGPWAKCSATYLPKGILLLLLDMEGHSLPQSTCLPNINGF
jgi:hypothetical protein